MIRQKNPETVYAGDKFNSVGPGHYSVSSMKAREKGFKMASAERKTYWPNPVSLDIGPGSYNTTLQTSKTRKKQASGIFLSKVNRTLFGMHKSKASQLLKQRMRVQSVDTYLEDLEDSSDEEASPGPGNYHPYNNGTFDKIRKPNNYQFFGSSEERFKNSNINKKVGPGTYEFDSKKLSFSDKKFEKVDVPFDSSDKRFRYTSAQILAPGPGNYNISTDFTDQTKLSKKNKKRIKRGIFGTGTKRKSMFEEIPDHPGPGYYVGINKDSIESQTLEKQQESRNAYGRVIPKSSSMFLSSVEKSLSYVKPAY